MSGLGPILFQRIAALLWRRYFEFFHCSFLNLATCLCICSVIIFVGKKFYRGLFLVFCMSLEKSVRDLAKKNGFSVSVWKPKDFASAVSSRLQYATVCFDEFDRVCLVGETMLHPVLVSKPEGVYLLRDVEGLPASSIVCSKEDSGLQVWLSRIQGDYHLDLVENRSSFFRYLVRAEWVGEAFRGMYRAAHMENVNGWDDLPISHHAVLNWFFRKNNHPLNPNSLQYLNNGRH